MAKVHDCLEMWQGSQNLCATQKESCTENELMNVVRYITGTQEIIKATWSRFEHDGVAALKSLVSSPLPPALSAKNLPAEQTKVFNVRWVNWIDHHSSESDEVRAAEGISNTNNWLKGQCDLDNPNKWQDDCKANDGSDIELGNGIKESECPEHRTVSAQQLFLDWFRHHGGQSNRLRRDWSRSVQQKQWGMRETWYSRTHCVNMFSPGTIYCLTENVT